MNLFRSEEHVERWLNGREAGATISVVKVAGLAEAQAGKLGGREARREAVPADEDHARLARDVLESPQDDRKRVPNGTRDQHALLTLLVGRARVDQERALLHCRPCLQRGHANDRAAGFLEQGVEAARHLERM
jgi:hypothetical protein